MVLAYSFMMIMSLFLCLCVVQIGSFMSRAFMCIELMVARTAMFELLFA